MTAAQTATFSVTAAGTGPLAYQWKKNGAAISGATAATYTTPATTTSDNGAQFSVTVSNSTGNVTSSAATLTVTTASVAPSISAQPVSQTVTAAQTATFSVTAAGTGPLAYQWKKNSAAISGATAATYTTPATTTSDNGAQFSVTVSNSTGNVTSSAATLTRDHRIGCAVDLCTACEPDRDGSADGYVLSDGCGNRAARLPVEEEWRRDQRCDSGGVHHTGYHDLR